MPSRFEAVHMKNSLQRKADLWRLVHLRPTSGLSRPFIAAIGLSAMVAPASASPVFLAFPVAALSIPMSSLPLTSTCVQLTYDNNGNRLSRSALPIPTSAPTWGSAVYGCSAWD